MLRIRCGFFYLILRKKWYNKDILNDLSNFQSGTRILEEFTLRFLCSFLPRLSSIKLSKMWLR